MRSKRVFSTAAVIVAAVGVVAVSGVITPTATADSSTDKINRIFLESLRKQGIDLHNPSGTVRLGHKVCDTLNEGYSLVEVGAVLLQLEKQHSIGLSAADVGYFVGLSVGAFCPKNIPTPRARPPSRTLPPLRPHPPSKVSPAPRSSLAPKAGQEGR